MLSLRILSGGLAGYKQTYEGNRVVVGRNPEADLCLHPELDLHASAHHASLVRDDQGWSVLDLGSANGTFLNGVEIELLTRLKSRDRIRFGIDGPEIEIVFKSRERRPMVSGIVLGGVVLLALSSAVFYWNQDRLRWTSERARLEASVDTLREANHTAEAAVQGRLSGLQLALDHSREKIEALQADLDEASRDPADREVLRLEASLQKATQALRRQQLAASLDFEDIQSANRNAVALVYAEGRAGGIAVATGFTVTPEGLMVTNRHVVIGADEERPVRIGVQFTGSAQVFPAKIVAVSDRSDLILLQVERLVGSVPTIRGLSAGADTVDVVAMIGFPLAASQAASTDRTRVPEPLVSAGVLLSRDQRRLEIQGYGAQGASGSPVFDGSGRVIGVVYGGRPEAVPPTVLAVPVAELTRLISSYELVAADDP